MVQSTRIPDDPTERLGFEVNPTDASWTFIPTYYPTRGPVQTKDRELIRAGKQCRGEDVSLKKMKNRDFHVAGVILASEIPAFQDLMDYDGTVDLISPLTPSGGMECEIKSSELGENDGWDPLKRQWRFKYTIDLVSTGRDEYGSGHNAIISALVGSRPTPKSGGFVK